MRNISFDNPYWLLIAIPLAAALLIPYFISVSKDNRSKGWVASLIIHIVIIISIALSAAGLVHTTVMTRTKVYVVADVSYSSERNLDEIDGYIREIEKNLPSNSMMGVVCFGKDTEILTSAGKEIKSVKESKVDDSGTDIAKALDFTANLFGAGEIKRIVLITDGFSTTADGETAAAVERLGAKGIKIDAIYLDNNLREGESEIQISDVEFVGSTYLNHESTLKMLIESSVKNEAVLDLYVREGEEYLKIDTTTLSADVGMNIATFKLPTDVSGVFDYKVEISRASADISEYNNSYHFTQTVAGQRSVLLVTEKQSDVTAIKSLYGESAVVHGVIVPRDFVPYTIEDLVKYDEIILSNVDIRKIDNIYAFIDSVDHAVSEYGKSLITLGDLSIQNQDDERFALLEELLPVSFGNANEGSKLYTIVIDISRSMYHSRPRQLLIAKEAAEKLVSLLNDDDTVAFVTLAGEAKVELTPTKVSECREELYKMIKSVEPTQGTFVGEALNMAYDIMKDLPFEEKQVMLISDGKQYKNEPVNSKEVAEKMKDGGITLSTISVLTHPLQYPDDHTDGCRLLLELAEIGGGINYDFLDENKLSELIFAEVADDLTDAVVEEKSKVNIETYRDDTLEGIFSLPDINGYVNSKEKLDSTTVLTVDYKKSSGNYISVPLYSYREHGNGRVSSFTSSLSGRWLSGWSNSVKEKLFTNILVTNTPKECVYYPFNISVDCSGDDSRIEIIPSSVNPKAKASIKLTHPDGTVEESAMIFDLNRYFVDMSTPNTGRYHIEITYTYGNHSFTSDTYFTLPYSAEYDAFAAYDIVNIYDFMRGAGQVSRDGNISLENDKSTVDTYEVSFRIPLLILCCVLFVLDVIIRKFKWKDIKGLFTKKRKEVAKK